MTRKRFIESKGAICKNWQWSWSFVKHQESFYNFQGLEERDKESREHIRLIEQENCKLKIFEMKYSCKQKIEKRGLYEI